MLMHPGDKLHVITRRLYEEDLRRHFVGEIQAVEQNAIRAKGYIFVLNNITSQFIKKAEEHVRIFSLVDSGIIINIIPSEVDIEKVYYEVSNDNHLVVTDGNTFKLDIQEFY